MIPQFEPYILKEYSKDVSNQINSGWIGPGKVVEQFENHIAKLFNVKYAISVTSGTIALLVSIMSLNISKKKNILFPSYTFLAGANAAKFMGYDIQLVDIKEDTLSIDPSKVKIDKSIGAVIFVNHNGYQGNDLNLFRSMCDENKHNLCDGHMRLGRINRACECWCHGIFDSPSKFLESISKLSRTHNICISLL